MVAADCAGGIALVVTRAIAQAPQLGREIDRLIPSTEHWLVTGPLHLDQQAIGHFSTTLSKQVNKNSAAIASTAVSTGKTVIDVITGLVLGVFTTIFLLYGGERIWAFVCAGFPRPGLRRVDPARECSVRSSPSRSPRASTARFAASKRALPLR